MAANLIMDTKNFKGSSCNARYRKLLSQEKQTSAIKDEEIRRLGTEVGRLSTKNAVLRKELEAVRESCQHSDDLVDKWGEVVYYDNTRDELPSCGQTRT